MDIRQLTARLDQIENNNLYEDLTLTEAKSVKLWENAGRLIKEAALTPDQIQQLFTSVEQGAAAAGGNRTMIGQGKDAASAVNQAWEYLKNKVQDSAPIKNVDSAYDSAVAKIEAGLGGPDNAVNQVIQKYRTFAKAHPIAQGLIYAALIAAAGISGAGLGGAAVLGLLKMTDKLLQGEKFSSATYSGATTGAAAYAAGQIGQAMKGKPEGDIPGTGADAPFHKAAYGQYADDPSRLSGGDRAFNRLTTKESVSLSESQIATLFTLIQIKNRQFNESMWDNIKNKAATVGKNLTTKVTADKLNSAWKKADSPTDSEAVAQVIQSAGVDPAVVSKAYTDMGIAAPAGKIEPTMDKPADTAKPDELADIKKNAGLSGVNIKDILAQILELDPKDQQQVLAYLKK